jgi:hypothetical protein
MTRRTKARSRTENDPQVYVSSSFDISLVRRGSCITRHKPDDTLLESACVPVLSVLTASDSKIHQQQLLTSFTFYRAPMMLAAAVAAAAASTLTRATICHSLTMTFCVSLYYIGKCGIYFLSAPRFGVPCGRMTDKATRRVLRLPAHPRGRLPVFDIIRPSCTYERCQRL